MIAGFLATLLRWLGGGVLDKVLGHLQARAASDVERLKVERGVDVERIRADTAIAGYRRDVITAGMAHRAFWLVWTAFALPLAVWFAWGVADSFMNGALPDVAELPPQLKGYAEAIFNPTFVGGAAGLGVTAVGRAMAGRARS